MSKQIKFLVMDVDGTLTDGKIYMGPTGEAMKAFDIKDGYGIHDMLIPSGIQPVIITGRTSTIVERRCQELGIDFLFQGVKDKVKVLMDFLKERDSDLSRVAYIGDDLNDMGCMDVVLTAGGIIGCPANAVEGVKAKATFVSKHDGGNGAVREYIDYLLSKQVAGENDEFAFQEVKYEIDPNIND